MIPGPRLDWLAERYVAPFVEAECAECHRQGGGDFRLDPTGGEANRRADFEGVRAFVNRDRPEESLFLLKVVPLADGGLDHAGGTFLDTEDLQSTQPWIATVDIP